jgi:hypothetical protein
MNKRQRKKNYKKAVKAMCAIVRVEIWWIQLCVMLYAIHYRGTIMPVHDIENASSSRDCLTNSTR